ncbi:MAG: hypothetical protein PWQ97_633 [Tepidanaerobacteraceae bacterium]|nr:hypothetical protein [Tepidanaerobacteraceae bacterium]
MKKNLLVEVGGFIVILSLVLFVCSQRSANDMQVDYRTDTQEINDNQKNNDKSFKYSSREETTEEFHEVPIKEVLSKGKTIKFILKVENNDWVRPTYSKEWDDPLFKERFPDPSVLVEAAMHRLFELPAGASYNDTK